MINRLHGEIESHEFNDRPQSVANNYNSKFPLDYAAAPTPIPVNPASVIGVSQILFGPNF